MSEKITLQEKAYRELIRRIVAGEIKMGNALREEVLAEALGLSATPMREALRRLEREGWVEMIPYRGCFLRKFDEKNIRELFFLRIALETEVVGAAAVALPEDVCLRLHELLRLEAAEIEAGELANDPMLYNEDVDFHARIAEALKLPRVGATLLVLQKQTMAFGCSLNLSPMSKEQKLNFHREHKLILQAIEQHRVQLARELVRLHLESACERFLVSDLES